MQTSPENNDSPAPLDVFERAYQELHALAISRFSGQDRNHTLQPTALVHEAYLKIREFSGEVTDQEHMLAIAARAMRQVLVDHARKKNAAKRGGDIHGHRVTLSGIDSGTREWDVIEINDALEQLRILDERQARIVELRFFGGLTVEQVAEMVGRSERAVYLDWKMARAWILSQHGADPDG
ncbi:MAG: sigma-70 family RNA polymerase sigma factor [Phycisphaerales bacterium]|nr:sigma-70 family RNA polymerase sigma factor [Phycisphaerales bacterium]